MAKKEVKYTVVQGIYKGVITLASISGGETFDVKEEEYNRDYKAFTKED